MKQRLLAIWSCLGACFAAAPAFAQNLLDVVDAAQFTIQRRFPGRDSLARKIALEELEKDARSDDSDDRIIRTILEKFPETSAELSARSDLNSNGIPDDWERRFNVSAGFTAPGSDEDADGFTLLQEYNAGADPVDPLSHPKYITRIYVSSVRRSRFPGLELLSVDRSRCDKREWVAVFNVVRNNRKRGEFVRIDGQFKNNDVDFSVIDIQVDEKTREPVVYIRRTGKDERIPCRPGRPVFDFVMQVKSFDSLHDRTFVANVGGMFKLGSRKTGVETYRIVSADPDTKTMIVESVGDAPETFKVPPVPDALRAAKASARNSPAKASASANAKAGSGAPARTTAAARNAETRTSANAPAGAGAPARTTAVARNAEKRTSANAPAGRTAAANNAPARPGAPAGRTAARSDAKSAPKKSKAEPLPIFHKKKNAQGWF